jgi:hypothetical protein
VAAARRSPEGLAHEQQGMTKANGPRSRSGACWRGCPAVAPNHHGIAPYGGPVLRFVVCSMRTRIRLRNSSRKSCSPEGGTHFGGGRTISPPTTFCSCSNRRFRLSGGSSATTCDVRASKNVRRAPIKAIVSSGFSSFASG